MSTSSKIKNIELILEELKRSSTNSIMYSQAIADKLGITPTEVESIEVITRKNNVTAGDIAQATGLTTGAVTGVIDRLEKAGLVKRDQDPNDRRKVIIMPNQETLIKKVFPLYQFMIKNISKLLEQYANKDLEIIQDFINKANAVSEKAIEDLTKQD